MRVMICALVVLCFLAPNLQAVGFRLPNQDPEAIARGNAFVATADNPSAIYYNPAGITQLQGHNLRVGIYAVSGGIEYESFNGAKAKVDSDFQPVPQFYYTYTPAESAWSFGLGVYAPYGLSVDWGDTPPFAHLVQKGKVLFLSVNPVVAWKPHKTLAFGIGPTINYSEANLKQTLGFPGTRFEFDGDGMGYGFNAGILWQPHEQWSFGLSYRYETEVDYKGKTSTTPAFGGPTTTRGSILYPQFLVAGVSFRPTENWNLEFNIDWTDWDAVNELAYDNTPIGPQRSPLNYRSSFMYEFGITRKLGDGYFVSAGYFFSENSSPDADFSPMLPDADLHLGSVGFGRHGSRWDWAVAYHFGYNDERVVRGSSNPGADGKYQTLNHALNVAVTLKF